MPYRIIVWAQDRADGKRKKGDIADVLRPGQDPGSKVTLPKFVIVDVTDGAGWQAATVYVNQWNINYVFSVLDNQPTYAQYRVEVDPEVIAASGKGANELKTEMRDYIETQDPDSVWNGATVDGFSSNSITITIPKPHDKQRLKDDFNDKFISVLETNRFYFKESGVDWAIGQGGHVSVTQAQALNNLVDKLDD